MSIIPPQSPALVNGSSYVTADELRSMLADVSALEQKIQPLIDPPLPFERVVNYDPSVAAIFVAPRMELQQAVWTNGGGDFWCCGLGYQVWWNFSSTVPVKIFDIGTGLGFSGGVGSVQYQQLFDFKWNVSKLDIRRGTITSYLAAPGSDSFLSRQALGNQETGDYLRFQPWFIGKGDALSFSIKPLGYVWPSAGLFSTSNRFTVHMTMFGFRIRDGYVDGDR